MPGPLIEIVALNLDRLLLLALLAGTLLLLHDHPQPGGGVRPEAAAEAHGALGRTARGLLVCVGIGWLWLAMTWVVGIPAATWQGPFDRLLQLTALASVAWLSVGGRGWDAGGGRWRRALVIAFCAALVLYLAWAPQWARAMTGRRALAPQQMAARCWDAWQALLAVGLAWGLASRRIGGWRSGVVAALLVGSAMDALLPQGSGSANFAPVWGRLGLLAVGIGMAASAVQLRWAGAARPSPAAGAPSSSRRAGAPVVESGAAPILSSLMVTLGQQAEHLGRLTDATAGLTERLAVLERRTAEWFTLWEARGRAEHASPEAATPAGLSSEAAAQLGLRLRAYEQGMAALPLGILLTDAHGGVAYGNAVAARLLGAPIVPGQALPDSLGHPEQVNAALRRLLSADASDPPPEPLSLAEGSVNAALHALRDPAGQVQGILAVLSPAPPGPGAVPSLIPELTAALRQPITSILGYSHLIGEGRGVLAETQVQRHLEHIDANLGRLRVFLDDLTALLDWQTPGGRAQASRLDLAACLAAAAERCRPLLGERGLSIEPSIDHSLDEVEAEAALVDLLLDNLLVFAVQRSPLGGDLSLEARPGPSGGILLSVQDRGRGAVAGSGPWERAVGLGDGDLPVELRMAYLIAERLEGRVWLENDEQGGRAVASIRPHPRAEGASTA